MWGTSSFLHRYPRSETLNIELLSNYFTYYHARVQIQGVGIEQMKKIYGCEIIYADELVKKEAVQE